MLHEPKGCACFNFKTEPDNELLPGAKTPVAGLLCACACCWWALFRPMLAVGGQLVTIACPTWGGVLLRTIKRNLLGLLRAVSPPKGTTKTLPFNNFLIF